MPIVNGKRVMNLPSSVNAQDILNAVGETRIGRKVLVERPEGFKTVDNNHKQKLGKDDKVKIVPIRVKATQYSYGGRKSDLQKQIIWDQIVDLEQKLFKDGIEVDPEFNWIKVNYRLPEAWANVNERKTVPLLLILPDEFPDLPTNGFYLPDYVIPPEGDYHFHSRGYGGAFGETPEEVEQMKNQGWKWYCTHILPEAWSPNRIRKIEDWRYGDNLWDIFSLIKDVLTDPHGD